MVLAYDEWGHFEGVAPMDVLRAIAGEFPEARKRRPGLLCIELAGWRTKVVDLDSRRIDNGSGSKAG